MANEKITDLPTVANANLTDIIYAVTGYVSPTNPGTSVQQTLQQVINLLSTSVVQHFAGNPNGNVAGTTYNLCWDTTDNILYVCTTSGTSTTAVWGTVIPPLTNGQVLIGKTGLPPIAGTLTAGTNITITNASGSITIAASGAGGFSWTHVTGTSQTMVSNNGYIADNVGLVTLALPATSALGDVIEIVGRGAGGWTVSQAAGQQIIFGSSSTTLGAAGTLSSSNRRDSFYMVCTAVDTEWTIESVVGNLTVV